MASGTRSLVEMSMCYDVLIYLPSLCKSERLIKSSEEIDNQA